MNEKKVYTVYGFPERLHSLIYSGYEWNPTTLAKAIGLNRKSIYRWLNGESAPNIVYFMRLCDIFHVSADWLIYGRGNK